MDEAIKIEMNMYRDLIDAKCRDFHGQIMKGKVNAYINKYCTHLPLTVQSSLSHHKTYNNLYDQTIKRRKERPKEEKKESIFFDQDAIDLITT